MLNSTAKKIKSSIDEISGGAQVTYLTLPEKIETLLENDKGSRYFVTFDSIPDIRPTDATVILISNARVNDLCVHALKQGLRDISVKKAGRYHLVSGRTGNTPLPF